MLIVNDEQRLRAGIGSLSKRCSYCSKALAAYPLILSDEARLAVYHAACAAALATEILVDLYTFFSPPAPYPQLFILTPPNVAPAHETEHHQAHEGLPVAGGQKPTFRIGFVLSAANVARY